MTCPNCNNDYDMTIMIDEEVEINNDKTKCVIVLYCECKECGHDWDEQHTYKMELEG